MARSLDLAPLPKEERRAAISRQALSLWGGGFRGLFSARILERLEQDGGPPLKERFDLIGGTSIGGILAMGIALGKPADQLRAAIEKHGPSIFSGARGLNGWLCAKYPQSNLKNAIVQILGAEAETELADIATPVVVTSVSQRSGRPKIFASSAAAPDGVGDRVTVLDAALATSAAPTYFPPHTISGEPFIDGGIVANAPDLILITQALRLFAVALADIEIVSVGTAGSTTPSRDIKAPGKIGWLARHGLIDLTLDTQAHLASGGADALLGGRALRFDRRPAKKIELDDASKAACAKLLMLADECFDDVQRNRGRDVIAAMSHRRH